MALSLTHTFSSGLSDGADTTLVRPSNWNAQHTITSDAVSVLARSANSSGPVAALAAGADGQVLAREAGALVFTEGPALGVNGGTGGSVTLNGSTSGSAIIQTAAAAGTGTKFQVPANNGTNTFVLQTDGSGNTSWVGASGAPGGSSLQLQYDNGGAFGGANVWRTTANQLDLSNSATAQALRVYNTTDNNGGTPTNSEYATLDWTTSANVLSFGTVKTGTGTQRDMTLQYGTTLNIGTNASFDNFGGLILSGGQVRITGGLIANFNGIAKVISSGVWGWVPSTNEQVSPDAAYSRIAPGVTAVGNGTSGDATGFQQWGGQARVTSDFSVTSSTALTVITGLAVALAAGRTYSFEAELSWTDAAAGGIQAAITATGGLTATNIIYDGWIVDSAANGIKGNAQATALGTAVASSATTGTAGHLTIKGTITVNVAGTANVAVAQNTSNGTATTVKRGSRFLVFDMP